ncbi:MAG: hypothetical protein GC192_24050 [Bacteroidetes bacterium]|nr:hypothetical protein [Bacteroidota bacterium]
MRRNLFLISILLIACASATGQSPYFKNYKVRDGLPSNNVYFVSQDSRGYIWFCTDVGVSRFDGAHFTNFTTADGLSDNEVFTSFEDSRGRIWFATLNGKPSFYLDGEMHDEHDTPLLKGFELGDLILNIFEEQNGSIILLSKENLGRLDFQNNSAHLETLPESLALIWPSRGDTISVLSDSMAFGFYTHRKVTKTDRLPILAKPLKISNWNDTIYVTDTHQLMIYSDLRRSVIKTLVFPKFMNEVISVTPTPNQLWLGSRNGAYLFDRQNLALKQVYLPDSQVSAILEDQEGGLWFSTLDNGVFYAPAPEILHLRKANSEGPVQVNSLAADSKGQLWFGMPDNIYGMLENGKLETFEDFPKNITKRAISNIRHMADGTTIISGKAGVLFRKGTEKQFYMLRSTDLNVDRKGNLWSALGGLYLIPKTELPKYAISNPNLHESEILKLYLPHLPQILSTQRVDRIVFDEKDKTWLATPNGLFYYQDKMSDAVLPYAIRDLIFDEETKLLWALSEGHGLFALRNGQVIYSLEIASKGQPAKICRDFCQDSSGQFWIATASGLMMVQGPPGKLQLNDYSNIHGIGPEKLNAVERIGDQIFLGKDDGLVAVPYAIFTKKLPSPPIYLTHLTMNGQPQPLHEKLRFPAIENSLTISFEGLSFKDFKKLHYRYRLHGLDEDWHTTANEAVEYASLRPSGYRFEVVAVNSSGVESAVAAAFSFQILKPFWMQWWFIVGLVATAAMMVFLWVKWRERKLRNRYELQQRLMSSENERLELQTKNADLKMLALRLQMNPHFIFNALNTIKGYYGQDKITQANSYIAKFARLLRLNLDYSDAFIPIEQEAELLKIYMQLSQIRYPDKMDFSVTIAPDILPSTTLIPSMVIQPFVENAVIHGIVSKQGKGHVSVHFTKNEDEIVATVTDDGIGRTAAAAMSKLRDPHKPLATAITEERLGLLRKTDGNVPALEVRDLVNENGEAAGTTVVLHLPMELNSK